MASNTIEIPSVCIPRVFINFDEAYIERVFCDLFGPNTKGESCVDHIDLVQRTDTRTSEPFYVAFVHFVKNMEKNEEIETFIDAINTQPEIKIEYNHPWFWKVRKNKATKRHQQQQKTSLKP
jgi:hypothetical protein